MENIEPLVDGWVSYDDRSSKELYSDETHRRRALLREARGLGADWVLAVDPDERFEAGLAGAIKRLTAVWRPTAWSFDLREMYTEADYRIDGLWGQKRRVRLFSLSGASEPYGAMLHGQWLPTGARHRERYSGFNLYHLRMISPERRRLRRDLYKALDQDNHYQEVGYDYLADDEQAVLEKIPRRREYLPAHYDDGGIWTASATEFEIPRSGPAV